MSQYQSRAERSESTQYRKTGRSGSSNQQRQFSGGVSTKGGGGASSAPTNRSSKKYNSNAPVGQPGGGYWSANSGDSSAARAVQNGVHQQQSTHRVSDTPATSTSSNPKPMDAQSQKITRAVPKPPASNVPSTAAPSNVTNASSEPKPPSTLGKAPGNASNSIGLQFGSLSPGLMNGMQIPARTSSAPPNLDEQKKDQARYESLRTDPALPTPSVPKQHLPRKDAGMHDQRIAGEAHLPSKPKRDVQVSAAPHGIQAQKPSPHPIPGMPMHLQYHQPQIPVQFGGPNPLQSQAMSGTSLPMPISLPLPLGNPPMQHSMFAPGLQPHPMQSQGMLHQGQSMNFSPPMRSHLSPQVGNMGMSIAPQFSQQAAVKFSSSRKTVKITHPETHEELRLDSSPGPRLHPGVQSQSQPISSFPPNMPMNFYHGSYNASSLFYPPTSSVGLNSSQVPPPSQPPRVYNQVTVKPPVVSHAEKEPAAPSGLVSSGKAEVTKPSRLKGENSGFPHKEVGTSSLSSSPLPRPGLGASYATAASSTPVAVERDVPDTLAPSSAPKDNSAPASTSSAYEARSGVEVPDAIKDTHKELVNRDQREQDGSLSTSLSSSTSKLTEAETVDANYASSATNLVSETAEESISTTVVASCEAPDLVSDSATEAGDTSNSLGTKGVSSKISKTMIIGRKEQGETISVESPKHKDSLETSLGTLPLKSPEIPCKIDDSSDQKVPATGVLSDCEQEKSEESSGCSNDAKMGGDLTVTTHTVGQNPESSVSVTTSSDKNSTSDVSFSVFDNINARETPVAKGVPVDQEAALVSVPSYLDVTLRTENVDSESGSGGLVSPSPSSDKDKVSDTHVAKTVAP